MQGEEGMRRLCVTLLALLLLVSCARVEEEDAGFSVVAVDFPSYDAARAVMGTEGLSMLLPPGSGSHSYEPTAKDMTRLGRADAVIYTGGPSEAWVDTMLDALEDRPASFRLVDQVQLLGEEAKEGMEEDDEEEEMDEHVWTSPANEVLIVSNLSSFLSEINEEKREEYERGRDERLEALSELDRDIRDTVAAAEGNTLIFASRFPLLYFVREYGLDYYAAFPGCAEETEPSARTIAFLIDKAKELEIPAVLYIELSSPSLARVIAEEAGCGVREFNSAHNVTALEFRSGADYISLMRENLEVLREVLG